MPTEPALWPPSLGFHFIMSISPFLPISPSTPTLPITSSCQPSAQQVLEATSHESVLLTQASTPYWSSSASLQPSPTGPHPAIHAPILPPLSCLAHIHLLHISTLLPPASWLSIHPAAITLGCLFANPFPSTHSFPAPIRSFPVLLTSTTSLPVYPTVLAPLPYSTQHPTQTSAPTYQPVSLFLSFLHLLTDMNPDPVSQPLRAFS